jgi:hypothetical protein
MRAGVSERMRIAPAGLVAVGLAAAALFVPAAGHAGGARSIAFTPPSHDYGRISVNATSPEQTFVLKNTGGSATGALTVP